MLDADAPAAHHPSRIWKNYRKITKHPQNGSSKGISTLKMAAGQDSPGGKTYEDAVRAEVEEQYLSTVPVPVHSMEMFYN